MGALCYWVGRRLELLLQENSPNSPRVSLFSLFLFEKFLLLKPAAPYKEGPVLSHSPPLQLDRGLFFRPSSQTFPSWCPRSPWVLTFPVCLLLRPYSPPCDFKQPGLSQCCSNLVWQGRELLTWLSPKSPAADLGLGLQLPWSPC